MLEPRQRHDHHDMITTGGALRILTWHVHGTYLQLLGTLGHEIFVPVADGRPARHPGLPPGRAWPRGLTEVPVEVVSELDLDAIVYQADENWLIDQHEILTPDQRALPRLFVEHDPPGHDGGSCFSSRHPVDDPEVEIVHVTHFNDLMWDCGDVPTRVIEHGVFDRGHLYHGSLRRGVVVVNNIASRGRRLGADVVERVRESVPLDLVGMGSEEAGGLGEISPDDVSSFVAGYRFFFHPIRHTSLGLALCEAMMIGLPVVALATTEATTVIEHGIDGYVHTDVEALIEGMQSLIRDGDEAQRMGEAARAKALRRFGIRRFVDDWRRAIDDVVGRRRAVASVSRRVREGP